MVDPETKLKQYEAKLEKLRAEYKKQPSLSIILQGRAMKTAIYVLKKKLGIKNPSSI